MSRNQRNGQGTRENVGGSVTEPKPDESTTEEDLKEEERVDAADMEVLLADKDREIDSLRESITRYQQEVTSLAQQLVAANQSELRGRRIADAGMEVLVQVAQQQSQQLTEKQARG